MKFCISIDIETICITLNRLSCITAVVKPAKVIVRNVSIQINVFINGKIIATERIHFHTVFIILSACIVCILHRSNTCVVIIANRTESSKAVGELISATTGQVDVIISQCTCNTTCRVTCTSSYRSYRYIFCFRIVNGIC